jgi:IclR family transcriptional regulator, KDG regulon repressor
MPTVTRTLGEGTQSVLLTVTLLECLASQPRATSISDLAKSIGTSKSRVFRHLRTLLACDYVVQDEAGGQYSVGPRLLALCRAATERRDLAMVAGPYMEDLRARFGHSTIVSRIEVEGVRVLTSISGEAGLVLAVRAGTLLPFDRSAQGRIALAFGDAGLAQVRRRFEKEHPGELARIRAVGIAAAQMRVGLMGIAAPIFDAERRLIGTLALLNTAGEMKASESAAGAALRDAARAVSHQLGGAHVK